MRLRVCLSVLIFVFLSQSIFSKTVNFFTVETPEVSIRHDLQYNLFADTKEQGVNLSIIAQMDMKELAADIGVNLSDRYVDFTTQAVYWPTFFDTMNLGVGFTYHLFQYSDIFTEQDVFADLCAKFQLGQYFQILTRIGSFTKFTNIKLISPDLKIINQSININFALYFNPLDFLSCYVSFDSNSYFNYPNFFTAFLATGVEVDIVKNKFSTGIDITTKWYDLIVSVQTINQVNMKIYGRYKI